MGAIANTNASNRGIYEAIAYECGLRSNDTVVLDYVRSQVVRLAKWEGISLNELLDTWSVDEIVQALNAFAKMAHDGNRYM
jgi:hypothetical protein